MTDQPQQFGNTGEYVDKANDYAQQNPDQARSFIDKIEDFVDEKTGGKYSAQIDQAGDWVEGQLGLPNNTNNPLPADPGVGPVDPEAPTEPEAAPPACRHPRDSPALRRSAGEFVSAPGQGLTGSTGGGARRAGPCRTRRPVGGGVRWPAAGAGCAAGGCAWAW